MHRYPLLSSSSMQKLWMSGYLPIAQLGNKALMLHYQPLVILMHHA